MAFFQFPVIIDSEAPAGIPKEKVEQADPKAAFFDERQCQSLTLFDNTCHQQSGFAWHLQADPTSLWDHPGVISELL